VTFRGFRPKARRDVEQIAAYYEINADRQTVAAFLRAIRGAVELVNDNPKAGSKRWSFDAKMPELRSWPLNGFPYIIFYQPDGRSVHILRVLHSARDIPTSLQD